MKKNVFLLLAFFGASTLLAQNTFPTTGNVGIGISTPATLFHVNGITRVSELQNTGNMKFSIPSSTGGWVRGMMYYPNGIYSTTELAGIGLKGTGTTLEHLFIGFGNDPWNTSLGMYVKSNGRIGIGNSNPTATLSITGPSNGSATSFTNSTLAMGNLLFGTDATDNHLYMQSHGNKPLYINELGNNLILNLAGGNVGIGVSNPLTKLHVKDSYILSEGSGPSHGFQLKRDNFDTYEIRHLDGGLSFFNATDGRKEISFVGNGNIGIGTTTPEAKLNISAPYPASSIGWSDMTKSALLIGTSSVGIGIDANEIVSKGGSLYIGTITPNTDIVMRAGSTEIDMFVSGTTGNVGVGTITPLDLVHVNSNVNDARVLIDGATGFDSEVKFAENGNVKYTIGYDQATSNLVMGTTNVDTSPRFVINSSGNIGIGTTSPSAKLQVEGNMLLGNGASYENLWLKSVAPSSGYNGTFEFAPYSIPGSGIAKHITRFKTSIGGGQTRHDVAIDGRLGLGTVTPETKLDIREANAGQTSLLRLTNPNGAINDTADLDFAVTSAANIPTARISAKRMAVGALTDLIFSNYNAGLKERMRIDSDGNVGIGTTTPDAKLAVNGQIHAQEVKIDLIGWPDYVFTKDYKLMSIEEVANYIKKYGYLPNMPSAKEVEKNGVLLGKMNKKLLEKIEELTLYTISQEKEIKKLQKQEERIQKIEEENKQLKDLLARVAKLEKAVKK